MVAGSNATAWTFSIGRIHFAVVCRIGVDHRSAGKSHDHLRVSPNFTVVFQASFNCDGCASATAITTAPSCWRTREHWLLLRLIIQHVRMPVPCNLFLFDDAIHFWYLSATCQTSSAFSCLLQMTHSMSVCCRIRCVSRLLLSSNVA